MKTTTVATNKVLLNEAQAEKDKKVRTAEGYRDTTKAEADAKLADQLAVAEGKRKQGEADAERIKRLAESLGGARGGQLIAAEYAKRFKEMTIQAIPFIYNGVVQPYLMQQGANIVPNPMNLTPLGTPANQPGGQK